MKRIGLLSLVILMIFTSCRKDTEVVTVTETPDDPVITNIDDWQPRIENINGDLDGFIYDENQEPVQDASVNLNGQIVSTDERGHFEYTGVEMNSKGAYLKVEKEGYFLGSRRFFPRAATRNHVRIQMLELGTGETVNSAVENVVSTNGNASVTFPAGAIADASGAAYEGEFTVHAKWLNPSAPETMNQMPGNLQGVNTLAEEQALKTLGMMAVELRDMSGNELNIAEGQTATLRMPVPENLSANAPAEIPLWSFEETVGIWVEEGTATLQGGVYVGEVSHFSFWNCDIPTDYTDISMTFQSSNGAPLTNVQISITSANFGTAYGWTDSQGYVAGIIPANESLVIEVFSYACAEAVFSGTYGPFSTATDLGVITVDGFTTLSGSVVNCDGDAVDSSVLAVDADGQAQYYYLQASDFNLTVLTCANASSVSLTAIDLLTLEESAAVSVTPNTDNDLGTISACGSVTSENILTITIDGGETYTYLGATANVSAQGTDISAGNGDNINIFFGFFGTTPGDYTNNNYLEVLYDQTVPYGLWGNNFDTFEITEHGDKVVGSWSGTLNSGEVETAFVECTFNIDIE